MNREQRDSLQGIIVLIMITFFLSLPFYAPVLPPHIGKILNDLDIPLLMFCPGIAALLTLLIRERKNFSSIWALFSLNIQSLRFVALSYFLPFVYCLIVYGAAWLIFGTFSTNAMIDSIHQESLLQSIELPTYGLVGLYCFKTVTVGVVLGLLYALGEEIGWRGYVLPRLISLTSLHSAPFILGIIWAGWHYPLIIAGEYNNGTNLVIGLICFTFMVIGLSYMTAWLLLKSKTLWSVGMLHVSHNVYVQNIFDECTSENHQWTQYLTSEFGIGIALCTCSLAWLLWKKYHPSSEVISH